MTKKDYILISDTLRAHFDARRVDNPDPAGAQEISLAIGLALEKDNPRFNLQTFLAACEGA